MIIESSQSLEELAPFLVKFFQQSALKIQRLNEEWNPSHGTPVFTVAGKYTTRGWTEWTEGFMYGCQILQFDATGDAQFMELGRRNTLQRMASHVSHVGVHDHGFNNVSTYGNLLRLALEERFAASEEEQALYRLALKVSGAVQAARWSRIADGTGYIYSFNGPHSLFSDTIRSCRSLVVAHQLDHALMSENDRRISLLERAMQHIHNTVRWNVFYGEGRDAYDIAGRVAHEGIFNLNDGNYRCPSTQQGYSPFSTWTRGLAWVLLGCAEQMEFFSQLPPQDWAEAAANALPAPSPPGAEAENASICSVSLTDAQQRFLAEMERAARATAEFYIAHTTRDGIPFWDTGAPGLVALGNYTQQDSQPDNPYEPVDSSAAAIAAQGLLRLGHCLGNEGARYTQAGLTVAQTLLQPPYLSEDPEHHGLLLHSVYHRPNGWDYVPEGKQVPQGESSMWGDYHLMELAVYLKRMGQLRFYSIV